MDIPREHRDVLMAMGIAVLMLQTTEKVIRLCMTLVLQKRAPLTLEALQEQEETERNKTLGYFLAELRKRADGHPRRIRSAAARFSEESKRLYPRPVEGPGLGLGIAGADREGKAVHSPAHTTVRKSTQSVPWPRRRVARPDRDSRLVASESRLVYRDRDNL